MNQKPAIFLSMLLCCLISSTLTAQQSRPNIIHILADDLGWGSVGFTNSATYIQTPNLDALAAGGMKLNRSYTTTVCSPSRASLMTGFHAGHSFNDRNANIEAGLRKQDVNVASTLTQAGYRTVAIGKWGWGADSTNTPTVTNNDTLPTNQGFSEFFGYLNHTAAHNYFYPQIWQSTAINGPTTTLANNSGPGGSVEYTHDLFARRSEEFVRDHASSSEPFYMQLNYTIPHFNLSNVDVAPSLQNLAGESIFPAGQAQYASASGLTTSEKRHAAMISRMDASIGSLIQRLQDPNGDGNSSDSVLDNTLILFTSDNGASSEGLGATSASSLPVSGGLRGGKRDLYEGGIRAPSFAFWNGQIAPGSSTSLLNDVADFYATAAELAGSKPRVGTDGVSIVPTLLGQSGQKDRGGLLFENFENSQFGLKNSDWAFLSGDMKLIKFRDGTYELYNVANDVREIAPLDLSLPANLAIRAELERQALAQGAGQADAFAVSYRDWIGSNGVSLNDATQYEVTNDPAAPVGAPNGTWSALIRNTQDAAQTALVGQSMTVLGLEVSGQSHQQKVDVRPQKVLTGTNEIRVGDNGIIQITHGEIKSDRWIDIETMGLVTGQGNVTADVYNRGRLAPGFEGQPGNAAVPPPAGNFSVAIDFSAIDSRLAKDEFYTPLTRNSEQGTVSLDYGPSASSRLTDRGFNDFAQEFNLQNWTVGGSLAHAITDNAFVNLVVNPREGLAVELLSAEFDLWRNGANSPSNYAILTNLNGFDANSPLASTSITSSGAANSVSFRADGTGLATSDLLEIRLYGWGAGNANGHTHLTGVDANLRYSTLPNLPFHPNGELRIDGDLWHLPDSILEISVGPADSLYPSSFHSDVIDVSGTASLFGRLELNIAADFLPTQSVYQFLTADSILGTFARVDILGNDSFQALLSYTDTSVSVSFVSVPEPSSFLLLIGQLQILFRRRRAFERQASRSREIA